jgi:hypothetical protein
MKVSAKFIVRSCGRGRSAALRPRAALSRFAGAASARPAGASPARRRQPELAVGDDFLAADSPWR